MRDPIRVLVLGAGRMGSAVSSLLAAKQGVDIVAACDRNPELTGADLGRVAGLSRELGVRVEAELSDAVERCKPDLAIQTTGSTLEAVLPDVTTLLERHVHVISIAEEMAYPWCQSLPIAEQIHRTALQQDCAVLGTGINPGFVLDLLVIALTGVCAQVDAIEATRSNDLSPYGPTVLAAQGVGLTPEAFRRGARDGIITGHVGFAQSLHLIGAALGWRIERIEQRVDPIVSRTQRATRLATVDPGQVAGCVNRATAYVDGKPAVVLNHPQQVCPDVEGVQTFDRIQIKGVPDISVEIRPELPGGVGTAALAVNMIPRVLGAAPGLKTMADLPVPAAVIGDLRCLVEPLAERTHG